MTNIVKRSALFAAAGLFITVLLFVSGCKPAAVAPTQENEGSKMQNVTLPVYNNPTLEQRADPWVYKHTDGYYYFTASVPEYDRIELRRAKTINELATAEAVTIWNKHDAGPMSYLIWAPELHFINDKWYIYFSAGGSPEVFDHRIFVLECSDTNPIEGSWDEKGKIKTKWDSFALDATTFVHNEKQYLLWAQNDPKTRANSNVYIASMSNPYTLDSDPVLLTSPELSWERKKYWVNEGPAVLVRNGKIYVTYSASATDTNYCMGMLWIDDTKDLLNIENWSKSQEPVFKTSIENSQFGPGHNSFTVAEDGKTDVLIYHARNYAEIKGEALYDPNRHTRAQAFTFGADGFPVFGIPVADTKR